MPTPPKRPLTAEEQRRFEATRDAATLQLLFKASRLANERALGLLQAREGGPRVRAAHTALFPHLGFEGIRLTDLAAKVGVTKQAVGPLVDDLVAWGMAERVDDPQDGRAKCIRFSRRGYAALMHGLGVLREIEESLAAAIGRQRVRELHETLALVVDHLQAAPATTTSGKTPVRGISK
jgi:DNA-binding MarR family transcriptional regulator